MTNLNNPSGPKSALAGRRFRANVNLAETFDKLGRLLQMHAFGTVTEYIEQFGVARLPSISLAPGTRT